MTSLDTPLLLIYSLAYISLAEISVAKYIAIKIDGTCIACQPLTWSVPSTLLIGCPLRCHCYLLTAGYIPVLTSGTQHEFAY